MKLLIFAHTPPPHHGQSYMVQLMLNGFGGDQRKARARTESPSPHGIACYHVNAQVSRELDEIGDFRISKPFLLLGFCLQAIWCRFRYGVTTLYYIPAPGKRSALYRDWMVMLLCRPFYKKIILHWHAAGLGKWLETQVQMRCRAFTYRRLGKADLSIALSRYNRADAEKLLPKEIRVVNNGIPDPCPDFAQKVLPRRRARQLARIKLQSGQALTPADLEDTGGDPQIFKILFLAHCTRSKGLFDAIKGVLQANQKLAAARSPLSLRLMIAGKFVDEAERAELDRIIAATPEAANSLQLLGFVSGATKETALREADFFCFPTFFENENQPVNLIEAMAHGLPILTTRWRSIPEIVPDLHGCLVDINSPSQIADALIKSLTAETAESFRDIFLRQFNLDQYLASLAEAFRNVESAQTVPQPDPAPSANLSQIH